MTLRPFVAAGLLLAACSGDAPTEPEAPESPSLLSLAHAYRMTGEATTTTGGRTAECSLDLVFELRERTGRTRDYVEYAGVHGGDVNRAVTAADGSGFAFSAFVFGELTMRRYGTVASRSGSRSTRRPTSRSIARWRIGMARSCGAGVWPVNGAAARFRSTRVATWTST